MPPPSPLTASERKLGLVLLAAIFLIIAMPAMVMGIDRALVIPGGIVDWMRDQWRRVFTVGLPALSLPNSISLLITCMAAGTLFLLPLQIAHLVRPGGWLSSTALWFWSMLYGFLLALCGGAYLALGVLLRRGGTPFESGVDIVAAGWLVLGLLITILASRAWRRRRREERAALAGAGVGM